MPAERTVDQALRLDQNYPNPFTPNTTIGFSLPRAGFVSLKIYSMLGKEVATLVSDQLAAGAHQRSWNAGDLPNGTYICRLQSGGMTATRKLALVR